MIILGTQNQNKTIEIQHKFSEHGIKIQGSNVQQNIPETGESFVENALIKARFTCKKTQSICIADDSGLVVPALKGQPGIFSSRFSSESASDADNCQALLSALKNVQQPSAYFVCVLVCMRHALDPDPIVARGVIHGVIVHEGKGKNGFGYDPIFYIPSLSKTMAQISLQCKNKISHRALALNELLSGMKEQHVC